MPRDLIQKREGPKEEISTPVVPHNRPFGDGQKRAANKADAEAGSKALSQEERRRKDFEGAKEQLSKLTYSQSVDLLGGLPSGVLELYLLAEEDSRNREEVLRFFPKPGARARERYSPFMTELSVIVGA